MVDSAPVPSASMADLQAALVRLRRREAWSRRLPVAGRAVVVVGVAALVCGAAGRLSGCAPRLLAPMTAAAVVASAAAWSLARARPASLQELARAVDRHCGSEDTALSAIAPRLVPATSYAAVVDAQAGRLVPRIRPQVLAPLAWRPTLLRAGLVVAMLLVAARVVPLADPFGVLRHRQDLATARQALATARHAAEVRTHALEAMHPESTLSPAVAQDLARLQSELAQLHPPQIDANRAVLLSATTALKQQLAQVATARFTHSVDPAGDFGLGSSADPQQAQALSEALPRGQDHPMQQALSEAAALARQLAQARTPAERQQLRDALTHQLATLAQAAKGHPSGFGDAVQQALDHLANASSPELHDQALQGLQDALALAKLEAQADAQGARDQQGLEEALRALREAGQLNDQGQLPEGAAGDMKSYEELYRQMLEERMAGQGQEQGRGNQPGQRGGGNGSRTDSAKDDKQVDAHFQGAQQHGALQPGKTTASWTIHGPSDAGAVIKAYQDSVPEVRQELPAALEREQVPPAYHEGVKQYFDGLPAGH